MVGFKSRKLNKKRKNKTRYFKNKHRHHTLKQSKHKSYRKTRYYYNARQQLGGVLPPPSPPSRPPLFPPGTRKPPGPPRNPEPLPPSPRPMQPPRPPPYPYIPPQSPRPMQPPRPPPYPYIPPPYPFSPMPPSFSPMPPPPPLPSPPPPSPLPLLPPQQPGPADTLNEIMSPPPPLIPPPPPSPSPPPPLPSSPPLPPQPRISPYYPPSPPNEGMLLLYSNASSNDIIIVTLTLGIIVGGCIILCIKLRRVNAALRRGPRRSWIDAIRRIRTNRVPVIEVELDVPQPLNDQRANAPSNNQVIGGANSLLGTIAESLKNIDTNVLTETFKIYFGFLDLGPNDYERIVKLMKIINEDSNLEELIIIVARGLGFIYDENVENVESTTYKFDKNLVHVLGNDAESRITAILQKCSQVGVLKLTKKKVEVVENVMTILSTALIKYFKNHDTKKLLNSLTALDTLKKLFK